MKLSTLEELLATPTAEETTEVVEVEGLGTVRIKAYSADEFLRARKAAMEKGEFDQARWGAMTLHLCVVEPALTYDQAVQLRKRPSFLIDALLDAIGRLSGISISGNVLEEAVDDAERTFRT